MTGIISCSRTVFTSHVYGPTFTSVGGGKASKPKTTVQDCVPTFVKVKPLDVFNVMTGQFPSRIRCFQTKPDIFQTLTECFSRLNLTGMSAQCRNIKLKM